MKYFIALLVTLSIFSCKTETKTTDGKTPQIDSVFVKADAYLTKLTELKKFNGVVLLQKNGNEVLRKAYNISSDTSSTLFVTEKSQFDLRSVAKLFAKFSVVQLEQKEKLNRQDAIENYIPNFPNGNIITIEHLMYNQSGLPRELSDFSKKPIDLSIEEVIKLAAKETLEFAPGTEERYSNIGFQLLYYIIGKTHGSSFAEYLHDTTFNPLKMSHSGNNFDTDLSNRSQYAFGHYLNDKQKISCECIIPDDDMKVGNLFSTVNDLQLFLAQLDTEKHTSIVNDGQISHAGGTRGKRAYIERNFEDNYTLIFLANYDEIPFKRLVSDLQNILKGVPVNMPKAVNRTAISVPKETLQQYEGTYDFVEAGHLTLTIKFENDSLYVYQKEQNNGILYPETSTTFFSDKTSEESFQFVKEEPGKFHILMDFKGIQWKGIRIK